MDIVYQQGHAAHFATHLKSWYTLAQNADWDRPQAVKNQLASASVVGDNKVVFNIAGNKYRLIVKFNYPYRVGYVRFVGTHKQFESPDPIEFIKNAMELKGLDQTGLAEILDSRSRASEILNKKRALTLSQIRKIAMEWHVPADPLIREYELVKGA